MTELLARCPCCSAPISPDRFLVDPNSHRATRNGVTIELTSRHLEILGMLASAAPEVVPHDALIRPLFGANASAQSFNTLKVHICKLRERIAPLGLSIETVWSAGYRLLFDQATDAHALRGSMHHWGADELKQLETMVFRDHIPVVDAAAKLGRSPGGASHKLNEIARARMTEAARAHVA